MQEKKKTLIFAKTKNKERARQVREEVTVSRKGLKKHRAARRGREKKEEACLLFGRDRKRVSRQTAKC